MSKEQKFCPLSMSAPADIPILKYQEEACAWWDEDAQACAILTLARSIRKVTKNGR